MISGVILDMDGTMFDTEKIGLEVYKEMLKEEGLSVDDAFMFSLFSIKKEIYYERMEERFGKYMDIYEFISRCGERFIKAVYERGIPKKKGLDELLTYLFENKYKISIASSSESDKVLDFIGYHSLDKYFDSIVTGDDITDYKPSPDIYIKAAKELGLDTRKCLAVEDSLNGIKSAKAAGCFSVLVPDIDKNSKELVETADCVIDDLSQVIDILTSKNSYQIN